MEDYKEPYDEIVQTLPGCRRKLSSKSVWQVTDKSKSNLRFFGS